MDKSCGKCKHWTPANLDVTEFGQCLRIKHDSDSNSQELACVEDHDEYNAWLRTKPEFCCALFEAKTCE